MRSLVIVIALVARIAQADDKPWAANVSAANQKNALALYQKGNTFFEQAQYKEAYAEYQQALALWDHPAIRYNAAVCLFNLDRPVEAYENMVAALRFGDAPLGHDLYKQGLNYKKLLEGQLAVLEIRADDEGATVSLDGKQLFIAPGRETRRVQAGDHQIVAAKPGYETATEPIRVPAGATRTIVLKLKPLAAARRLERRWANWKPWAVVVAGAVVGAAGLAWWFPAKQDFEDYDAAFASACRDGCTQALLEEKMETDAGLRLRGEGQEKANISYALFGVGGAGVAVGMVLVLLNQKRLGEPVVQPTVGPDRVGATISVPW